MEIVSNQKTISFIRGKGNINHNNRKFLTNNIDKNRVKNNIVYVQNDLKNMYTEIFQEAVDEYNSKQKRSDRRIDNYYEKVYRAKKEKVFHEVIVQIGEKDMTDNDKNLCKNILDKYMRTFQDRNPSLRVVNAIMHLDESTPHLHIDFIPVATGYKQGMSVRNSISKALNGELVDWYDKERKYIKEISSSFGIEIIKKNEPKREKLLVNEYKSIKDNSKRIRNALMADFDRIEKYIKSTENIEEVESNTIFSLTKFVKSSFEKTGIFGKKYYSINDENLYKFCDALFKQINDGYFKNLKSNTEDIYRSFGYVDKIDFEEISMSDYYLKKMHRYENAHKKEICDLKDKNNNLEEESNQLREVIFELSDEINLKKTEIKNLKETLNNYENLLEKHDIFEIERKKLKKNLDKDIDI